MNIKLRYRLNLQHWRGADFKSQEHLLNLSFLKVQIQRRSGSC